MDEYLFKRLLFAGEEEEIEDLIKLGYFKRDHDKIYRTEKYQHDTEKFINVKKIALYEAVKKLGSAEDMDRAMEMAGIKDFITFIFIAEELVEEGKFKKDPQKNCVINL
jgi:DNA polymerase II large subunit